MRSLLSRGLLGALLVLPGSLAAQYRTSPGDTLRYREISRATVTMEVPTGPVEVRSAHDGVVGVTWPRPGEAAAWYERLSLRVESPGGAVQAPATDSVLRQPFALSFTPRGELSTRSTPAFPAEVAAVTDLTRQFNDFFISLPAAPLRVGSTWADTAVDERARRPEETFRSRLVRSFRAERDTLVDGRPALVISVREAIEMEASSPMENKQMRALTRLSGTDEGIALFSVEQGRLLGRERRGAMSGVLTLKGGPTPVSMPQRYEYTGTLTLQR